MKDYDGPVYRKKEKAKNEDRRFNKVSSPDGTHRLIKKNHEPLPRPFTKAHSPLAQYKLPRKTKTLKSKEGINQPVDADRLKDKIERNLLNQRGENTKKYQVSYFEKQNIQAQTFSNAKETSALFEKVHPTSHFTELRKLDTALGQHQAHNTRNHPQDEKKSLSRKEIRVVSQRLVKDKDSFLLMEQE